MMARRSDSDRMVRPGAWVAELTGMLDLVSWPEGMQVIVRKKRPHPGAQLRSTEKRPQSAASGHPAKIAKDAG
jgi:hypothetical protein